MSAAVALFSFTCTPAPAWVNSAARPRTLSTLVASAVVAIPRPERLSKRVRRLAERDPARGRAHQEHALVGHQQQRADDGGTTLQAPASNRISDPAARVLQSAPVGDEGKR